MSSFILNDRKYRTSLPDGAVTLDLIRGEAGLTGTKEGCREGDCGACTVLLGAPCDAGVSYIAVNSCLLPAGELEGNHLVTVEGVTPDGGLSALQEIFADLGASQCGFCTPGMILSLTGYFLSTLAPVAEDAVSSLGGNICRCTGYMSVKRAAEAAVELVGRSPADDPSSSRHRAFLVKKGIVPEYFQRVDDRLGSPVARQVVAGERQGLPVAGGTDLFATHASDLRDAPLQFLLSDPSVTGISRSEGMVTLGAAVTVSRLMRSGVFREIGDLQDSLRLVSSVQVRNRATIGGNIVNASPIGDLAIILLALNAVVNTRGGPQERRSIPLRDLYLGYKELDLGRGELIETVSFTAPGRDAGFSFEKVSMREHLDIASVNTAAYFNVSGGKIRAADISAGGVAPVPLYLRRTSALLAGMPVCSATVIRAVESAAGEISPISDVRGSADYKRLLLGRLLKAHFLKLFPDILEPGELL